MEYKKRSELIGFVDLKRIFVCIKCVLMGLFLSVVVQNYTSAYATIDPNYYSVVMSMQNQNQGINISGAGLTEYYASIMRTISVTTNAPSGYRIYVNVPADEESGGDLVLLGGGASSPSISKINSTPATATTLSTDTWGFGIPNTTTGLPTNNYSASYTAGTPSPSSTYAGVKISPDLTLVRNVTSAVSGTDSFNIYYGMLIGEDVLSTPGTYSTNISYHALIEATNVVGGEATITPTSGPKSGYETVTITTSLKTDFVPSDIHVTIGGLDCTNPRGNINTGVLRITCVTQAHTPDLADVVVGINSLGLNYTIVDGYEYLETGDVKITNVSYVSGTNVNGTPNPSVDSNNNVDFDLTFKSGIDQNDNTFSATYRFTMANTTSSDYIFTAPVSNLTLRLSSTTTSEVYYELSGISVGDTIPANSSVTFNVILTADYASGTHGVEGGMEVEPIEDKSGTLVGSILGSNEGDLTGNNDLAMFQLSVRNTFSSSKVFTIDILGNDFVVANSSGGFLDAQTISANSTSTYTFYVKKASGATYGSDFVNAAVVLSYDGVEVSGGALKLAVDKDPSFIDNEAPYISNVSVVRNDTIGSATVSWTGTDNVGVASYSIYPCTKSNNTYSCGSPVTGISGNATSYTLTGLSDGIYGIVVVGFDDEGNTASQSDIDGATTDTNHASRTDDTELRWTFTITGKITNGSLTSSGGSTVQMGGTYTGSISPNNSYSTPSSITVTMGGVTMTSGYTYRNGSITIDSVTGDVEITASCPYNWCLIEGTMVALADGTSIPIEQVTYDTLLKVWNYETGSVGAEYPAWIEKRGVTETYRITRFDDGSELKTAGWHGVFDVDKNEFVSIDSEEFDVGTRIYKVNENDELEIVTVTSIEIVEEEVGYYHVVSSQYYNIIANDIITTDGAVYLSNLYGFDENIKWPELREQIISDPDNLYTYADFEDIGLPRKMFDDLRVGEAKYLAERYGISLEVFKWYLISNQLNTDIWLPYCEASILLRAEYCPAEHSENEPQATYTNETSTSYTSVNIKEEEEEEEEDTSEFESELEPNEPLGVTTAHETTTELQSENNLAGGILVGSIVATTFLGLSCLVIGNRGENESENENEDK